ncbi:MAG: hypothetical protein OCU22_10155, partial [Canidatus Methanoxibalbensis ujae]|nr:hypothetical protein [Candidatus Methanoxibalbensis ujae]
QNGRGKSCCWWAVWHMWAFLVHEQVLLLYWGLSAGGCAVGIQRQDIFENKKCGFLGGFGFGMGIA